MSVRSDAFAAFLLARGVVSPEQLIEACHIAQQTGAKLADALVKLNYASSEQVMSAIAEFNGIQFIDLTDITVSPAIIELMPESVARENTVLPLCFDFDARTLTVVMVEPDRDVLEKLEFILNKEIRPAIAAPEQIVEAINRHYGQSETESVDSMLAEFTDTAIDFTETDASAFDPPLEVITQEMLRRDDSGSEASRAETSLDLKTPRPRLTDRRATVRYYHRMNPQRMFPLLVILSHEQVREVVKRGVSQAQSQSFQVAEGSLVEVEPVLPGCSCFPPREQLRVTAGEVSATFWVVPEVLGKVMDARVVVRQEGKALAEVPLQMHVVRQNVTRLMGALSLVLPFVLLLLKHFGLDFESQSEEGFALYARIAGWLVQHLTPEVLTGLLVAATVGLYFWLRPRRREVFWDIQTCEPTPVPAPAVPAVHSANAADLYGRAKQAFARHDEREGQRLLGELLAAQPLHTPALLLLAARRDHAGDLAGALALYERALATGRGKAGDYFRAALAAGRAGDLKRALAILQRAEAELPAGEMKGPLWYNLGCYSARLGRFPDALRYLNRAVDAGFDDLKQYEADPDLEPLRWSPGFQRLLVELAN